MRENMKTKIRNAILSIVVMVILVAIFISNNAFAKVASEEDSPVRASATKSLSYPSIRERLASQVDGDYVYITHDDLIKYPSIFCSAKGTSLPGYASTVVRSGGKSTDTTDGGTKTGFLTMNAQDHATVFKNGASWVDANERNPYSETTSKTYGRFKITEPQNATPAEAWVLTEMDLNDPSKNAITYEITNDEYKGEVNDNNKYQGINSTELWAVAWDDESLEPTKFVTKKNDKYYYVKTDSYAPYTYVQHAWWKEKTVGTDNKSGVKDTDLAYEAEAFEEYIKKIAVNGSNWEYNEDHTIKVDYTNYISTDGQKKTLSADSSKEEVRFNSETNKYVVGPFTLNYLRAGTKQGVREKVSFSGISQSTLIGLDADGKELLDKDGESILQLGKNYKFIYDHNHEDYIPTITTYTDGRAETVKLDTEEDYPYPYDGEEFYIEIDYLDNLVSIESLDFDFQYMNAGATFEYLTGEYLIITWSPWWDSDTTSGSTSGSSLLLRTVNDVTLGMADISSRGPVETDSGTGTIEPDVVKNPETRSGTSLGNCVAIDELSLDAKNITGQVGRFEPNLEFDEVAYDKKYYICYKYLMSSDVGETVEKDLDDNNRFSIERKFDSPVVEMNIWAKVTYKKYSTSSPDLIDNISYDYTTKQVKYTYKNDILKDSLTYIADGYTAEGSSLKLKKSGIINDSNLTIELPCEGVFNNGVEEIKDGRIEYTMDVIDNTVHATTTADSPTFSIKQSDKPYTVEVKVISSINNEVTEHLRFSVYAYKMYIGKPKCNYKAITGINNNSIITCQVYNMYGGTANKHYDPKDRYGVIQIDVLTVFKSGIIIIRAAPNNIPEKLPFWMGRIKFKFDDYAGNSINMALAALIINDKYNSGEDNNVNDSTKDAIQEAEEVKRRNSPSGGGSSDGSGGSGGSDGSSGDGSDDNNDDGSSVNTDELQEQIDKLNERLDELYKSLDEDTSKLGTLHDNVVNNIREQYENKYAQYQQITQQLEEKKKEQQKLESQIATETDAEKKKELEKDLEQIKKDIQELEQQQNSLYVELVNLKKAYDNLNEIATLYNEISDLQIKEGTLEGEILDLETEIENLEGENSDDTNKELEEKIEQKNKELTEKQEELTEIQTKISEDFGKQKTLLKEIETLIDKDLYDLYTKIIQTRLDIIEIDAGIESIQAMIDRANSSVGSSSSGVTVSYGTPITGLQYNTYGYRKYYLKFTNASEQRAQDQINGRESTKKDIDAVNGRGADVAGPAVHLQILPKPIDLRTNLGGKVWIEAEDQKDNSVTGLGVYEKDDDKTAPVNSVEIVVWKVKYEKSSGKEISREKAIAWQGTENSDGTFLSTKTLDFIKSDGRLYIDKDGEYKIDKIQIPSEEGLDTSKYKMAYDIEFLYDGQTYEATEYLKSTGKDTVSDKLAEFKKTADETRGADKDYTKYVNDSYIVENAEERKEFDSYFTEVYGEKEMEKDGTTEGKATGGKGGSQYNREIYGEGDVDNAKLNYTAKGYDNNDGLAVSTLVTHDDNGFILEQYKFAARTSEAGLLYAYEDQYHVEKNYYDNFTFQGKEYKPVDEYFTQINLGLVERYQTDISLLKDLYKAKVVVNEQETDYTYNAYGELTEGSLDKRFEAGYREKTYNIGLYNSDYKYRSSVYSTVTDPVTKTVLEAVKDGTELRLFVTYRIAIKNESENTDVSINEFKDYYDSTFTLVDKENIKTYISTGDTSDSAREEKVVAYTPYYRKLVASPNASELYDWNKTDDLNNKYIDKKETNDKELVTGEVKFEGLNSEDLEKQLDKQGFKGSVSTSLKALSDDSNSVNADMTLEPGETFEIFVTYEVDRAGFEKAKEQAYNAENERPSLKDDKNNIAEITKYSTVYTKKRHNTASYKAGQISGRIDRDSAPDNIRKTDIKNAQYYEDDTASAPVLSVDVKANNEIREINGTVWEDLRKDGEEGNGVFDAGEPGIEGVDVTLVEKISVTRSDVDRIKAYANTATDIDEVTKNALNNISSETLDYEFEYVWPDGTFNVGDGDDGKFDSTITTDKDGNYKFRNFVAGNYVVRFEYGNTEETLKYNGQDYKNTAYQTGITNASAYRNDDGAIYKGNTDGTVDGTADGPTLKEAGIEGTRTTLNNQWHDLSADATALNDARVSDARDYEPRRIQVNAYSRTITNKNAEVLAAAVNETEKDSLTKEYEEILKANKDVLIENTKMVANTAKFVVDIEKQSEITYDENVKTTKSEVINSGEYKYTIENIDFGLVKRPETRMYIQKEISKIELTKNDGAEVILSVTMDEEGNIIKDGIDTMKVDKITEIAKSSLEGQGFKYIAMDSSYLNGLQVMLTYNIKVYNESETDYVTEKLANIKNVKALYDEANKLETDPDGTGFSPYDTGKGIVYGKLVGLHYYTNNTDATNGEDLSNKYKYSYDKDIVVTTTVDQLVDYIDNDISRNLDRTSGTLNQTWVDSTETDRLNKLSAVSYVGNSKVDENGKPLDAEILDAELQDDKGRSYIGTNKNNVVLSENENMASEPIDKIEIPITEIKDGQPQTEVKDNKIMPKTTTRTIKEVYTTKSNDAKTSEVSMYNTELTTQLEPGKSASIGIVTSQQGNTQTANNMNYDNLVEIVMYSNTVGRRDMEAIPGNANMVAKELAAFNAGYDRVAEKDTEGNVTGYKFEPKEVTLGSGENAKVIKTERDAYAAKDTITFSEPTGLSLEREKINTIIRVILVSLIIAAIAVMTATVIVVLRKTRYDDKDILNGKN